jgi:uracil-DNA glycosylase
VTSPERYPFGRPVRDVQPSATGARRFFILGAYPSAFHVRWTPPPELGLGPVQALAVADEPEPFWDGSDEHDVLKQWMALVSPVPGWGQLAGAGRFNGSSGRHLDQQYLAPLGASREDVWITDAVNRHFVSEGGAAAIASRYLPAAEALGLPPADLPSRPSTHGLIALAAARHRDRLLAELDEASPEHVLTIGNEALAVFWELGISPLRSEARTAKLSAAVYGRRVPVVLPGGHQCVLHPLAHPNLLFNSKPGADPGFLAGIDAYRAAHARWADRRPGTYGTADVDEPT